MDRTETWPLNTSRIWRAGLSAFELLQTSKFHVELSALYGSMKKATYFSAIIVYFRPYSAFPYKHDPIE